MNTKPGNSLLVGIDFGTTKTMLAYCTPGSREVRYPLHRGPSESEYIPTVVALESGRRHIGRSARFSKPSSAIVFDRFKLNIEKTVPIYSDWLNADIAGIFLADLRRWLVDTMGQSATQLTITVPAEWSVSKRLATLYSARLAGFDCPISLLEEPLAAFLRARELNDLVRESQSILVFDFGGGTCDLSLLVSANGKHKVDGSKTIMVGGSHIDDRIVQLWLGRKGIPVGVNPQLETRLRFLAESYKRVLSKKISTYYEQRLEIPCETYSATEGERTLIPETENEFIEAFLCARDIEDIMLGSAACSESKPTNPSHVDDERFDKWLSAEVPEESILLTIKEALETFLDRYDENGNLDCVVLSGGMSKLWVVRKFLESFLRQRYNGRALAFFPGESQNDIIDKLVVEGAALHRYYANKGDQVAVPSLNQPVRVTIRDPRRVVQVLEFKERTELPTRFLDDIFDGRWYFLSLTKARNLRVVIETLHNGAWVTENTERFVPFKQRSSPLAQQAWRCSLTEYALVELKTVLIDIVRLKRTSEPLYLYPTQEQFDTSDVERIHERQIELGIRKQEGT